MPLSLRVAVALIACTIAAPIAAAGSAAAGDVRPGARARGGLRPALAGRGVAGHDRQGPAVFEATSGWCALPGSGYSDNALWQAARLAADVWAQTGKDTDRVLATGSYKRLIAGYPSSSLVAQARPELARLQRAKAAPSAPRRLPPRDDRVIPVPPPTPLRARDVPRCPPRLPLRRDRAKRAPADRATISDVKRVTMPGAVRVTIELDREVSYHEERIGNPDRVFLDLRGTGPRPGCVRRRPSRTARCAKSASGSARTTARGWCSRWTAPPGTPCSRCTTRTAW